MYKHLLAISLLVLTFVGGPSLASAQGMQDGTYNQAPAGDNTSGQAGATDDRGGFDWRWLLPLLAVPLLFMLKRDKKSDDRSHYRDQGFAGTKGGSTRRDNDRDEDAL